MKQVKHGWRIRIDDGRWIEALGIETPGIVLLNIPFTNFRVVLERPGIDNFLEPGKDY